jgi:uncharacterized membrane protein
MRFVRWFAIGVLAFLGLSAVAGAIPMITASLRHTPGLLPLSLLEHSPFHSYLIPGILLLAFNGLLALWVLWVDVMRRPRFGFWTALQGCVLIGWLAVQCWMLREVIWWHYFYGAVALALIVSGIVLRNEQARLRCVQE